MSAGGLAVREQQVSAAGDDAPVSVRPRWGLRIGVGLIVVAAWVEVAMGLTWPLPRYLWTHHLVSWWGTPFDLYQGAWAMAWQTDVLSGHIPVSTWAHANIFAPEPNALFYGQTGWGALPLFAPIFLLTRDPTISVNLTFLLGLALTAVGLHLVVWRWTGSIVAGAVAGATFITNPWVLRWFVPTAPQLAAMMWMPWIALLASLRPFRPRHMVALAALVALQSLTDVVYVTSALVAVLTAQAALRIVRPTSRADGLRLLAAVALGVLAIVPLLVPFVRVVAQNPDLTSRSAWQPAFSPFPFASSHPVYLAPVSALVVLVGLVCRAAARRRSGGVAAWSTALTWTVVGVLLSLPPVMFLGSWVIPSPVSVMQSLIPATAAIRAAGRLGVVGLIGVALLAGLAFAEAQRVLGARARNRTLVAAGTGLVLVLYLVTLGATTLFDKPLPWPRSLMPAPTVPPQFATMLHITGRPVLQLPVARDDISPALQATAMYRSIGRWYPLVNGYASYWPPGFERRMRVARHLPDPKAIAELVRTTNLGAVWVDGGDLRWRDLRRWKQVKAGDGTGLMPVARKGDSVLYLVTTRR